MNLLTIDNKCPFLKSTTAVHDPVTGGLKTEDFTPIIGDERCKKCKFNDGIDLFQGFVNCIYPHKY